MTILGQNIRYLRQRAGMSQAELAAKCHLTKQSISKLEIHRQKRQTIQHAILANYLGYDLEYLSSFLIEPPPKPRPKTATNLTLEAIHDRLVQEGHCVVTKNKFEKPF